MLQLVRSCDQSHASEIKANCPAVGWQSGKVHHAIIDPIHKLVKPIQECPKTQWHGQVFAFQNLGAGQGLGGPARIGRQHCAQARRRAHAANLIPGPPILPP